MLQTNRYPPFEILEAISIGQDPQETGEVHFHWVRLQEYSKSVIEKVVCCKQ